MTQFRTAASVACLLLSLVTAPAVAQDLWINEFHYDNAGSDVGEFIEVVVADSVATAPASIDVVLYNGSNGESYDSHALSSFAAITIPGFTIYSKAISGIQNGGPDGVALIDDGTVVQFLSYEGSFTATNGPANGVTSSDIGVSEDSGTPAGESLQLSGSGSSYADFTWSAPATETPGAPNNGQTLVTAGVTLAAGKTGPEFSVPGEQISYRITLDNLSATEAVTGLMVTDTLPANATYVSDTSGVTADTATPGQVSWVLPDLAVGESSDFDLILAIDPAASGLLINNLMASGQAGAELVDADSSWETALIQDVSIYEIQTPDDLLVDDASPLVGQVVQVDGVVTAAPDEIGGPATAVIQESAGGPYSGVRLVGDFSAASPQRGDEIRVIGEISEPFNLTQISISAVELIQSVGMPAAEPLTTAGFAPGSAADSEPWESVLIEFTDVTVTNDNPDAPGNDFGEWLFSDGSGDARGDDFSTTLTIDPALGNNFDFLRGIGWFSFGNYKLQPRDNADVGLDAEVFSIQGIQGSGLASPLEGQVVRTEGNLVTAVGSDFFVIQAPDPVLLRAGPGLASRGLFVFTDSPPAVAVGDAVTVQGPVVEFFGLTQIRPADVVEVTSSGNTLPVPVAFDSQTPSPDPAAPSCGVNNFECFESMRVSVPDGFVTGASQRFGSDLVAEAFVSATGSRLLRGPGVEFPGLGVICPDCPVWSGAPERFELDPDRITGNNLTLAGGTTFSATGVIGFEFGGYELWPTDLSIHFRPELPVPAPVGDLTELTIASLNALNFFDDIDDPDRPIAACGAGFIASNRDVPTAAEYQLKLDKLADTIIEAMGLPDVVALQEVESDTVLQALADRIATRSAGAVSYSVELVFGNDRGEINNGFLINTARVAVDAVLQEGAGECLSSDNTPLHDRPTLTLEGRFIAGGADWPFVVMNNHLRSLGGVDDEARVRLKRHEQAQSVAARVQARQTADPDLPMILIGDKNAFEFTDGFVDVIGLLSGTSIADQNLVNIENEGAPGFDPSNQVSPPLVNALKRLTAGERYSFVFREGSANRAVAQALDHALLNQAANRFVSDFGYMRGNADSWVGFEDDAMTFARSSDHDGLVLVLDVDSIFGDRFESQP